jgi:hypothetical protein
MSTLLGCHAPNRHFESGELNRMLAMGCLSYVVYVDNLSDAAYWVGICQQIRAAQPTAQIHVRLEKRGGLGNPTDEATQASGVANLFVNLATSWTWRNEPNIECDANVTAAQWGSWLTTFLQQAKVRSLVPLYAPPVSPGARDANAFLDATAQSAKAAAVVGWHAHAYGNPNVVAEYETDLWKHRSRWGGKLVVTEYNFGAGRPYSLTQYAAEIPEACRKAVNYNVDSVNVFIWQWRAPDIHLPTTVDVRDTVIEPAMKSMQKSYGGTPVPTPPGPYTEAVFERQCADVYHVANVPYNPNSAFTKFWKASWKAGVYLGAPEANESPIEDTNYLMQRFASETLWASKSDFIVHKGIPPFS